MSGLQIGLSLVVRRRTPEYACNETVLVVDADREARDAVQGTLLTSGYHLLRSSTASEAVQTCRQWKGEIDLILMNFVPESGTGTELVRRLHAIRPLVRVLYFSSCTARVLKEAGGPEFGDGFIQKPFLPDALLRKVRRLLDA